MLTPAVEAAGKAHVTIRGLCKRFDHAVVYDGLDLDIPRGKLISIFGPNGCGKSTLINMPNCTPLRHCSMKYSMTLVS